MKPDISNRDDIEKLVQHFYEKLESDAEIGYFFTEILSARKDAHLSRVCDFWENVIFYTGEYEGSPLEIHRKIHQQHPTNQAHFNRWLQLFDETVNSLFEGPNAEKTKNHSRAIAVVMLQNI